MDYFAFIDEETACEGVPLAKIASEVGTPAYVYSGATLDRHCQNLKKAFTSYPTLPCFAVKSNHNLSVLKRIFSHGFGADVVSVGEMERALLAGVKPNEVVFSGVGKQAFEIERGLRAGILSFNVESAGELELIAKIAEAQKKIASVSLRINPNIDAKTNPYIATGLYSTKFGVTETEAKPLLKSFQKNPHVKILGLACHIGSQITEIGPFQEAIARLCEISRELIADGFALETLNLGGGLGIRYQKEAPPSMADYAETLIREITRTKLRLLIEPGRVLVGNIGVLITRVVNVKATPSKTFVIVDAAMNDLIRPSLYGSYHEILPVRKSTEPNVAVDIVGPICETGDFLGLDRSLPSIKPGDLLYVRACGAYGSTMASNYNTRPRSPEVLVDGENFSVVRRRERLEDLWAAELPAK